MKKMNCFFEEHKTAENIIAALFFCVLVLGVTIGCGTMGCGWHFVDDHEFLEWINPVHEGKITVAGQLEYVFWNGFSGRFRPLYAPFRFLTILLFGNNIRCYALLKAAETILAFYLLFLFGRTVKASFGASMAFALVAFVGYQSAIWWKLGPQEVQGTIFFVLGMILLEKWIQGGRNRDGVLSFLFFWIMSNWKESFILLLPFIVVYLLYRTADDGKEEGNYVQRGFKRLRKHWLYLAAIGIVFVVIVSIIVLRIGTNSSSGGGISMSIGIRSIVDSYYYAFGHDLKYYAALTPIMIAILLTYWEELKRMWKEILLFGVFLAPQLLLYGKEAMAERYIVPSSIGYALFFILAVSKRGFLTGKRKLIYRLSVIVLLLLGFRTTLIEADYFRYRGESVTNVLEYIRDEAQKNSNVTVMSCLGFSNPEADNTIAAWMEYYGDEAQMYYWSEADESVRDYRDQAPEKNDQEYELYDMDIVVAYNATDRHYTGKCKPVREQLLDTDYTLISEGSVDIYVRNDSGIELPSREIRASYYS